MKEVVGYLFLMLIQLLKMAAICACIWGVFWLINAVMWLSGIGGEALLTEIVMRDMNPWLRAVVYIFEFEWLYALAIFVIFIEMLGKDGDIDFVDIIEAVIIALVVIFVYDPRIAPHLPAFIADPIHWLQTSCHARLVGGFSMLRVDFSGNITDPVYYTLFDILVAGGAAFWVWTQTWGDD